jgi:hypothetical protein
MVSKIGLEEQLILRVERELRNQLDVILKRMQDMAKNFGIEKTDEKSPFKNVVNVATDPTSSLEVIKTYIRSQVGRSGSSPIWKVIKDKKLFAAAVVEQINSLEKDAQQILENIESHLSKDSHLYTYFKKDEAKLKNELHLKLTQLYLGYLSREHTARVGELKYELESKGNNQNLNRR